MDLRSSFIKSLNIWYVKNLSEKKNKINLREIDLKTNCQIWEAYIL